MDSRPERIREVAEASLKRLRIECIAHPQGRQMVLAEGMGPAGGAAARHAQVGCGCGAPTGRDPASYVGRPDRLPLEQQNRARRHGRLTAPQPLPQ